MKAYREVVRVGGADELTASEVILRGWCERFKLQKSTTITDFDIQILDFVLGWLEERSNRYREERSGLQLRKHSPTQRN